MSVLLQMHGDVSSVKFCVNILCSVYGCEGPEKEADRASKQFVNGTTAGYRLGLLSAIKLEVSRQSLVENIVWVSRLQ